MIWFKHPIFVNEIYSDGGNFKIVGRRVWGNEFEYTAHELIKTRSREGYLIEGWRKLGKPTNLEEAKQQCQRQCLGTK